MKLSVKSDYAARAVLSLTRHHGKGRAMKVEELGTENRIPPKYLVQILIDLKSRGIVRSVRGKEGGYLLARSAAEITLGEVIRAVHGAVFDSPALSDPGCPAELRLAWQRLQSTLDETANSISFQQLADEAGSRQRMYYI
ncbi:MAG TPA: transcriptional regulator, BadM/Rrf2 family protein [Verrucomicrobiales bacterium]|nr:transcriptional regulator, BadM/Rrf2 family protein [Verrucomicrobiales bacterium]